MSSPDQDFPDSKRPNEPNDCQISSGNQTTESRVTSSSETSLVQTKKRIKVYPERLNRVRAKKPKTRTGCRTCKIRRVKCGEEFPTCLRCDKFGVKCDGYNTSQPQKPAKQPDLLSRRQGTPIRIMPKTALFQNENEHQYFLYFRDDITLDLSGNIPDKLWNLVILRASVEEPALRHLSIAISALRKSQTYPESPEAVTHHQFAISQYGRALKRVQDVLRTYRQEEAIRISLTASLLIFCFENTLGQHEQAVAHIRSALLLVRKRLAETPKPYVQWRTGSDLANLEGEVMDSFVRLDNILMTRLGDTSNDPRARSIEIKYSDDFKLPKRFRDSVEAKQYLEHLQFRAMPFFSYMPEFLATGRKHEPYIPPAEFYNIESHLDQFAAVFEPTLAKSSPEGDFKGWVAAATIRVQLLLTKVSLLRVSYGNNPIPADEFNEQCLEIVNLSARIIRDRRFRRTFVMSCDVLPALFVVLLICPGRVIKEEAIRILKSAAGRVEVIWDAVAIAAMGERILRAEGQAGADSRPWKYPRCQKVKINSLIPERHRNKDSDKAGYEY